MDNNFDQNQQMQYDQQAYQSQYQQIQYEQQPYQYQQPLYEKPAPNSTTYLVMSIIGLALSTILGIPLAGIIVSAIAMHKGKVYFENGGVESGETKASKVMSIIGLIMGIIGTVVVLLLIIIYAIIFALALADSAASTGVNSVPGIYY